VDIGHPERKDVVPVPVLLFQGAEILVIQPAAVFFWKRVDDCLLIEMVDELPATREQLRCLFAE
jgi:hypothetical protein